MTHNTLTLNTKTYKAESAPMTAVRIDVVTLTGEEYDALRYEVEDLRNVLRKLVEHGVTYWDSRGEVRHDVGTSQAEAMAIFREARQLLAPNASNEGPDLATVPLD